MLEPDVEAEPVTDAEVESLECAGVDGRIPEDGIKKRKNLRWDSKRPRGPERASQQLLGTSGPIQAEAPAVHN